MGAAVPRSGAFARCSPAAAKFSMADFERMQQDVVSFPARRFLAVLKRKGAMTRRSARCSSGMRRTERIRRGRDL